MHDLDRQFRERTLEDIRSSSLDTCYRWAHARIWLEENTLNGEWYSDARYPWVKPILNSRARYNWVMKGAQVGVTVCGFVRGLFEIAYHGRDVMYLLPTDKVAALTSKTRISNLITASPYLKDRVEDLQEVKRFGTNSMYVRGANGDINVKSTPIARLIMDEIDEMSERQIQLALERLSGCDDPLVWGMSTPTYPGVGIHKLFLETTQEHFFFDCPHCGKRIELTWPDSFVVGGHDVTDPECSRSYLRCHLPSCEKELPHDKKPLWLRNGLWLPTAVDANPDNRGFYLPQMYSPKVNPTQFAMAYHRGRGDEAARREFHNSKCGLPFVEDGSQVRDEHIDRCCQIQNYELNSDLPTTGSTGLITLGIDQGAFHHWSVVKWTIDLKASIGNVNDRAKPKLIALGKIACDDWEEIWALMYRYQIRACVIDFFPEPTKAREFARRFPGHVWLCQYVTGRGAREIFVQEDDYFANVAKVDKSSWLSKSLGRVMDGQIAFPRNIPLAFRQQLKGQIREYKRGVDGNYQAQWNRIADDHWGHSLNYNEIALNLRNPSLLGTEIITKIR